MNYFTCLLSLFMCDNILVCITSVMCHNFNIVAAAAAVNIAWAYKKYKRKTHVQKNCQILGDFIIKISCICTLIRYYFWLMAPTRNFDKFLLSPFHSAAISWRTCTTPTLTSHAYIQRESNKEYTRMKTIRNFHAMDLRWHPFDVLSGSWNSSIPFRFVNNKSFYMRQRKSTCFDILYLKTEPKCHLRNRRVAKVSV